MAARPHLPRVLGQPLRPLLALVSSAMPSIAFQRELEFGWRCRQMAALGQHFEEETPLFVAFRLLLKVRGEKKRGVVLKVRSFRDGTTFLMFHERGELEPCSPHHARSELDHLTTTPPFRASLYTGPKRKAQADEFISRSCLRYTLIELC